MVEEVPAYEPCGSGEHTYLWIEKRGIPTMEAVRRIARALGKRESDVGYAGMKDAQAVTRQYVSLAGCAEDAASRLDLPGIRIVSVSRHRNKLKIGHLRGNRFLIVLRGAPASDLDACRRVLGVLLRRGVPNYFGEQRFGRRADTHLIGFALLRGDPSGAAKLLFGEPTDQDPPAERQARDAFEKGDLRAAADRWPNDGTGLGRIVASMAAGESADTALARLPQRLWMLYLNAAQSELFNRVLARRLDRVDVLLAGDLAFIHAKGAVFRVPDPAIEAPRAVSLEISPSGPLFGSRMIEPEGEPGEIERGVLAESGIAAAGFDSRWGRGIKGARRPLRVPLADAAAEPCEDGIALRFALPPGAYATCVLREMLKEGSG